MTAIELSSRPVRASEVLPGQRTSAAPARAGSRLTWESWASNPIRIGSALLDPDCSRVTVRGDVWRLRPKDLAVLLALVERAPGTARREALFQRVWPKAVVVDNVLDQAIARLRRILADVDGSSPIETLPKRGYRLTVPISRVDPIAAD